MKPTLNPGSPVPLYHQLAEDFRYRIATGKLAPGQQLPPVREAARMWNVNLHTVRRAYGELVRDGLAETRPASGTRVLAGSPAARVAQGTARFVDRVIREAHRVHRLSPPALARLIADWKPAPPAAPEAVYFLECSVLQCAGHCREIEAHFAVAATPWLVGAAKEPPRATLVATYFHYNDLRQRWPHRLDGIRFVTIRPDPALPGRIAPGSGGKRRTLWVCELEETKARSIAADLSLLFPAAAFDIRPRVLTRSGDAAQVGSSRDAVLLAPRVWGALPATARKNPRLHEIRYVLAPGELAAAGEQFGWPRRRGTEVA